MESTTHEQSNSKAFSTWMLRLFSSALLIPCVLWILLSPSRDWADPFLGVFVISLVAIALNEFFNILKAQEIPAFKSIGIVAGCLLTGMEFLEGVQFVSLGSSYNISVELLAVAFIYVVLLAGFFSHSDFKRVIIAVASTLFGVVYVAVLFNFMIRLYYHPEINGPWVVFFLILVTKASDGAAYIIGSSLGRHPFVPRLSPGKTWEGVIGALVVASILGACTTIYFPDILASISWSGGILLGVVLGIGAMAGDLIESLFKRQSGIKDSGQLFPGIGGMLDLLDSLLFNAPIVYFLVELVLAGRGANL